MCDFCSVLALLLPTGTAARPFGHADALHTGGAVSLFVASALIAHRLALSHVILLQLLQIMNWRRCNCNVCGRSPKVTVGNYVRLLFSPGPAAAHRHCGFALPLCNPAPPISHVIPLGLFQTLNSGRWNCNVFGLC